MGSPERCVFLSHVLCHAMHAPAWPTFCTLQGNTQELARRSHDGEFTVYDRKIT